METPVAFNELNNVYRVFFHFDEATLFEPHNFPTSTYTLSLALSFARRNPQWLLQMFFKTINLNLQHLIDK